MSFSSSNPSIPLISPSYFQTSQPSWAVYQRAQQTNQNNNNNQKNQHNPNQGNKNNQQHPHPPRPSSQVAPSHPPSSLPTSSPSPSAPVPHPSRPQHGGPTQTHNTERGQETHTKPAPMAGRGGRGRGGRGGGGGGRGTGRVRSFSPSSPRRPPRDEVDHIVSQYRAQIPVGDSPEEIAQWIAQRKRRFPTAANIVAKAASLAERRERGEIMEEEKMKNKTQQGKRGMGQGNGGGGGGKKARFNNNNNNQNINSNNPDPPSSTPIDPLASSASATINDNTPATVPSIHAPKDALASLLGYDDSDDDAHDNDNNNDDEGPQEQKNIKNNMQQDERGSSMMDEEIPLPHDDAHSPTPSSPSSPHDGQAPEYESSKHAPADYVENDEAEEREASVHPTPATAPVSVSAPAPPSPSSSLPRPPRLCHYYIDDLCHRGASCAFAHDPTMRMQAITKRQLEQANNKKGNRGRNNNNNYSNDRHTGKKDGGLYLPKPEEFLWRKLVTTEMEEENNIILQCFRYFVKNNFFMKESTDKTSTTNNQGNTNTLSASPTPSASATATAAVSVSGSETATATGMDMGQTTATNQ